MFQSHCPRERWWRGGVGRLVFEAQRRPETATGLPQRPHGEQWVCGRVNSVRVQMLCVLSAHVGVVRGVCTCVGCVGGRRRRGVHSQSMRAGHARGYDPAPSPCPPCGTPPAGGGARVGRPADGTQSLGASPPPCPRPGPGSYLCSLRPRCPRRPG